MPLIIIIIIIPRLRCAYNTLCAPAAGQCNGSADTIGTVPVPWVPMLKYKYIYQIKYTEAILSNSTRKLLWFEITKMSIAVLKCKNYSVIYYNFQHTFVPCRPLCNQSRGRRSSDVTVI